MENNNDTMYGKYKGCGQWKDESEFSKRKDTKRGYKSHCNECRIKNEYEANKNEILAERKEYRKQNIDAINLYQQEYRDAHKKEASDYQRKYKNANRAQINADRRERRDNDPNFKIADNLRRRMNIAIKEGRKSGSVIRDLGCSIEELKWRIENMFYPDPKTGEIMTWENYGYYGWHIDHILPLSSFDLTDREQFLKACNFNNLQPMWGWQNFSKNDKLDYDPTDY
jgi:hypothetical protein